jgi:hypothetical protein
MYHLSIPIGSIIFFFDKVCRIQILQKWVFENISINIPIYNAVLFQVKNGDK